MTGSSLASLLSQIWCNILRVETLGNRKNALLDFGRMASVYMRLKKTFTYSDSERPGQEGHGEEEEGGRVESGM